jgi:hypothetical protein
MTDVFFSYSSKDRERVRHLFPLFARLSVVLALLTTPASAEQIELNVAEAHAEIYELSGKPTVFVELFINSAVEYSRFTRTHTGTLFVFKVEGEEIMTRKIVTSIDNGHFILDDFRDMKRAEQVAERLRKGAAIQVSTLGNK